MRRRTGFTQSISLFDRHFQTLVNRIHQFSRERSSAAIQHPKRAKIVLVHHGMFAQEKYDRRDDVGEGDFLVVNNTAELLDIEFRHYDEREAGVEGLVDQTCKTCRCVSGLFSRGTARLVSMLDWRSLTVDMEER